MAINFNIHLMKHNFMKYNEAGPNVCSKISKEVSQGKYLAAKVPKIHVLETFCIFLSVVL